MADDFYKRILAAEELSRRVAGITSGAREQLQTAQMLAERFALNDLVGGMTSRIENIQSAYAMLEAFNTTEHFKTLSATALAAEQARLFADESISKRALEAMHAAAGPLSDLRSSGLLDSFASASTAAQQAQLMLADYEARFRLPTAIEAKRLLEPFELSATAFASHHHFEKLAIERAMDEMRSPWLDMQAEGRSLIAFAELQGIGHSLATLTPFGDNLVDALRLGIGDWRDRITWPENVYTDLVARSEFYSGRGFNTSLTDFPAQAFEESLEIARVGDEPPPLVAQYGNPIPHSADDDEEEGFRRTNKAHDWLQRFEAQLRRFIDDRMTQAFGSDWPKHRLPNGLYDQWIDKKRKAEEYGGSEFPLICYADFTDYERVICKGDNWKVVFHIYFRRQEAFREAMQRLWLPRISTMHSRPITQDDELLVFVEVKRLAKVFNED